MQNKVVHAALNGKAPSSHSHLPNAINAGTLGGMVAANANAMAALETAQLRNVVMLSADPGVGVAVDYPDGTVIHVYE